ncbi:MAG: response regulator, partial [Chloroflexi bacterium]|nr:response regulator [Chloroflexota bacterium]
MDRPACAKLRVLVAGQQNSFVHVLATNIRRWGHEVTVLPSMMALCGDSVRGVGDGASKIEGDVLLYDLDESHISMLMSGRDAPAARLTIALSSDSMSSTTLEKFGAVAMLQKPFEMGRLQHYLRVLQRLLLEQEEARQPAGDSLFAGQGSSDGQEGPFLEESHPKIRVLVVDDDVTITNMIRNYLMLESRYEVVVAHDGLEALEQCLDWKPHCIVTDLIMPWMNGYQVMRCLSASSLQVMPSFVIMGALAQHEIPVGRSYLQGKVVAYIDKPFAIDLLLTAIEQVCIE